MNELNYIACNEMIKIGSILGLSEPGWTNFAEKTNCSGPVQMRVCIAYGH